METIFSLMLLIGVLISLYILGRETLIHWSDDNDSEPTPKEVILFVLLFIIAQKALSDSFKRNK